MYVLLATAFAAVQSLAPPAAEVPAPPAPLPSVSAPTAVPCCTLAKLTPVYLTVEEALASDKSTIGQSFVITLSRPVQISDGVVIPAGTRGVGEVVHAAKSRAMGKPGELLLAARYLDWNGTRIPLRSFKIGRPQGEDNADTAMFVGLAVGAVLSPFITGGEVRIPAGAGSWAKVAADVPIPAAAMPTTTQPQPITTPQGGE